MIIIITERSQEGLIRPIKKNIAKYEKYTNKERKVFRVNDKFTIQAQCSEIPEKQKSFK